MTRADHIADIARATYLGTGPGGRETVLTLRNESITDEALALAADLLAGRALIVEDILWSSEKARQSERNRSGCALSDNLVHPGERILVLEPA